MALVETIDTETAHRGAKNSDFRKLLSGVLTLLASAILVVGVGSAEAIPDDTGLIQNLYQDLLNRSPEPDGLASWLAAFQNGSGGRLIAVQGILGSVEYDGRVVDTLYQRLLGRSLDAGAQGYVGALQQGIIREQVMASILASGEYFANRGGGTELGFLRALYQDVLHRDLDAVGQAQFGALLASGVSRGQIALTLLQSREARQMLIGNLYELLLLRAVDAMGRDSWIGLLEQGGTVEDIIAAIVASDEYYNLDRSSHPPIGNLLVDPFGGGAEALTVLHDFTTLGGGSLDSGCCTPPGDWSVEYTPDPPPGSSPVPQAQPLGLILSGVALCVAHGWLRVRRLRRSRGARA